MYDIAIDAPHALVEVRLGGMLSVAETTEYMLALKQAMTSARLRSGYVLILDVSACTIQSQEMIRTMGTHMAVMPKERAIAVVTGSSLARMQVRRLFTQSYARITATQADARGWVLSGIEPPALPVPTAPAG